MRAFIPLQNVHVDDILWAREQELVRMVVLPYQWEMLNDRVEGAMKSHCIENFRIAAGESQDAFEGMVFQDSDLYKWLEAVAYSLAVSPDENLEAIADEAIALIGRTQRPDGYLNTYYTTKEPNGRWSNMMEGHELYCAGHLIEAAVAYYDSTGKRSLLDIACRLADHIDSVFGREKQRGYPGHPEIELALIRLYDLTKKQRYLTLADYFLSERGMGENLFEQERARAGHWYIFPEMAHFQADYFQSHLPVKEQRIAAGHAVRAMYLYSAMTDVALRNSDAALRSACLALFEDTVGKQMYVTGGIGSAHLGERFTTDYDLPNDSMYAETCASIGLMMLARRMWLMTGDAACFDVWERALYNTVLSGIGQDGHHFFYVNPLNVIPAAVHANPTLSHVRTIRQEWFGVACCPPNLARTLTSLGGSVFAMAEGAFYVLSHIAGSFHTEALSGRLSSSGTQYTLAFHGVSQEIRLRIPEGFTLSGLKGIRQSGYFCFRHAGNEVSYTYMLEPDTRLVRAHPKVAACAGKTCVMRGATVYCLEEADNHTPLSALWIDSATDLLPEKAAWLPDGMVLLRARGYRLAEHSWENGLYSGIPPVFEPVTLTLIPYSQWANRGEGEMCVWIPERSGSKE